MKVSSKQLILAVVCSLFTAHCSLSWAQTPAQFTLSWKPGSTNEDGFNVYRDGKKVGAASKAATQYKDQVTGNAGQQFCYEVSAFNAGGESARTNQACAKIPEAPPVVTVPAPPSGLTVSALSTTSIRLSWAKNSDNETGYVVDRRAWAPEEGGQINVVAGRTYWDNTGLKSKRTYCYQIKATGKTGDSTYSNESCATTR